MLVRCSRSVDPKAAVRIAKASSSPTAPFDGTVAFTTSTVAFTRSHERTVPIAILDEDPGLFIRPDEIRARVTLTPLAPASPTRDSNSSARRACEHLTGTAT
jgi:hypothetical protein